MYLRWIACLLITMALCASPGIARDSNRLDPLVPTWIKSKNPGKDIRESWSFSPKLGISCKVSVRKDEWLVLIAYDENLNERENCTIGTRGGLYCWRSFSGRRTISLDPLRSPGIFQTHCVGPAVYLPENVKALFRGNFELGSPYPKPNAEPESEEGVSYFILDISWRARH